MLRVPNPTHILYVQSTQPSLHIICSQLNSNIICSEYSTQLKYHMFRVLNPAHILYVQSTQPSSHIIYSEYSTQPRYFILRLNPTKVSDSYYSIKSLYLIYSDLDIYLFLDLLFFIQT